MRITNYKYNGAEFANTTCLLPICDTNSEYRYLCSIMMDGMAKGSAALSSSQLAGFKAMWKVRVKYEV